MKAHSIKTDNTNIEHKKYLRQQATKHIDNLRVLDLFAGNNVLWGGVNCEKYYGIEKEKGKGKNLNADNIRIIASLDLSQYNVIDCDSYGIPLNQIAQLFRNHTLQKGTVIIYTCISNAMSGVNKECIKHFKIEKMYKKVKTLFNAKARDMFYGYLYDKGITEVYKYTVKSHFTKDYGYFIVD